MDILFGAQSAKSAEGAPVTVAAADRFVVNRLQIAANVGVEEAGRSYLVASSARTAYLDAHDLDPQDTVDPGYKALRDAEDEVSTVLTLFNSQIYRIPSYDGPNSGRRPLPDTNASMG